MSTAVWSIAGFLSADGGHPHRDRSGLDRARAASAPTRSCAAWRPRSSAAWSRSRVPRSARSRSAIVDRVLFFNYTTETGLVQFLLFIVVLVLVAAVSQQRRAGRRRELPVRAADRRRCPNGCKRDLVGPAPAAAGRGVALLVAVVVPLLSDRSERHQTWTIILALRVVRGVGRRADRLGRAAVARPDGVRRARRAHGRRARPRACRSTSAGATPASSHGTLPVAVVPVDAAARRGRSRASSRCSSASARCACGGCSSR